MTNNIECAQLFFIKYYQLLCVTNENKYQILKTMIAIYQTQLNNQKYQNKIQTINLILNQLNLKNHKFGF